MKQMFYSALKPICVKTSVNQWLSATYMQQSSEIFLKYTTKLKITQNKGSYKKVTMKARKQVMRYLAALTGTLSSASRNGCELFI